MKNTKPNRDITAESRPRRFGKSTMVEDSFLVASKAGQSAIYQHPDYVCLTRKSYEALTKQKEEIVKELRMEKEEEELQQPYLKHINSHGTNCCFCSLCGYSEMNMTADKDGNFPCNCSIWDSSFKGNWIGWIDGIGEEARRYRELFYPNGYNIAVGEFNEKLDSL